VTDVLQVGYVFQNPTNRLAAIFFEMPEASVHYLLDAVEFLVLYLEARFDEACHVVETLIDAVKALVHKVAQV
jgi:hypothetical protein